MKKSIITAIAVSFLYLGAAAKGEHPEKYCAKMENGKKVVMHEGSVVTTEVTLKDGTKIKPDGTIVKRDGSTSMLKEGQCLNMEGNMSKEAEKSKHK